MTVDRKSILYMLAASNEFNLKRETTEDRLRLQKTIYLLQVFGLRIGYGFSWYRYGPYSQELVYDAYKVLSPDSPERTKYVRETRSLSFSASIHEKLKRFREICGNVLSDPKKLELAASVDFVRKTWHQGATRSEMPSFFKTHKQLYFNGDPIHDSDIEEAFAIIDELKAN